MNKNFIVQEENRLDKFLSLNLEETRNQIEHLIKKECVKVDGKTVTKAGLKLKLNQNIEVFLPEVEKKEAQEIDFDVEIIYEDDDILVINKPSNLIVHDAPSVNEPTLVDWLKKKNISLSTISGEERHGIVHRLDKGTSGLMVVAKSNEAHVFLSEQLQDKSMGRYYLAIIDLPLKDNVIIEKPMARNPTNRLKMGIVENGKFAKSAFSKIALSKNETIELIAAKLFTGRTHQIRVHLSSINRHILGDNLYGFKGDLNKIKRVYLHAYSLYLVHPRTKQRMDFLANIPNDMNEFLNENFNVEEICEKINQNYIIDSFGFAH
ncbi:MAG: RluA family pseudouridine synthase [Arcobacteraceae bacterium]|jgi:23S rRNA pseudouridine1911/1915/1917 synthase|nr:RluA family pseudouridine synthase [Arcobacteraceae bacterium]